MVAPLSTWPWDKLGNLKYLLYGPLVVRAFRSRWWKGSPEDDWSFHILTLCCVRALLHTLWSSFSNMLFLNRRKRIITRGVDFKQIDQEWDWDNFLILQASVFSIASYKFSSLNNLSTWDWKGFVLALIFHVAFSEPLYYWLHRKFHRGYLFSNYHCLHHSSPVPQPSTAENVTFLEHMVLCFILGIPLVGSFLMGHGSTSLVYGYILTFDFLRCLGHSNMEFVPHQIFDIFPFARYLLYTPTYHSLHHTEMNSNFCLFMPIFDYLGNTLNPKSWDLQKQINSGKKERVPDFVFLVHVVDMVSSLHAPFFFRSFGSIPFSPRFFLIPLGPMMVVLMLFMWILSKTFLLSFYLLRGGLHQTWIIPRFGFQYFLPFAKDGINNQIENAILTADRMGVKVISLAALNKNESLNGGGMLFVNKHPNLRVRVVHGNTLTAAVILNEISKDVKEVFLTGATSKLGRAIALYLSRKSIRVLMLTSSSERFTNIQKEAPVEFRKNLVLVTKYQAAQNCKTWIIGKWILPREQQLAPRGTHFHQFVVPPILPLRKDCTYGNLAAMRLPKDVEELGVCEYTLGRGVVHACHAGGVIHLLEGWTHNEVGAIDVDKIDVVWNAALKHGLTPVYH